MGSLAGKLMSNVQPVTNDSCKTSSSQEIGLTLRELEVLRGIAEARRNSEIAQQLFISTRTVEKHVENILRKLGVKRRTQAALHFRVMSPSTENASETALV